MPGLVLSSPAALYAGQITAGLVSVTTRSGMHKQGEVSTDTTGHTAHHRVEVVADTATSLRARWGWWSWMDNALSAGTLLLDAALVTVDNTIHRLTFSGVNTATITLDGSGLLSTDCDVIAGVTITRAQVVAVRSYLRAQSGTATFGASWYSDTGTLSWYQSGNHLLDDPASPPSAPGPEYANTYYCSPISLLGVQS